MKPKLQNIDHIHVFVPDREDALDWYSNILGLKPSEEIIVLPESGPLMIRNNEENINIALFKGTPKDNKAVIAFKVSGEEFINCHNKINDSLTKNIEIVDHDIQFSIYFEDPFGNPYEITSYDYDMLTELQ
jgi:catechol 2,3-dioxygenase-like lactoylglutathione lyase family enzyme